MVDGASRSAAPYIRFASVREAAFNLDRQLSRRQAPCAHYVRITWLSDRDVEFRGHFATPAAGLALAADAVAVRRRHRPAT